MQRLGQCIGVHLLNCLYIDLGLYSVRYGDDLEIAFRWHPVEFSGLAQHYADVRDDRVPVRCASNADDNRSGHAGQATHRRCGYVWNTQ